MLARAAVCSLALLIGQAGCTLRLSDTEESQPVASADPDAAPRSTPADAAPAPDAAAPADATPAVELATCDDQFGAATGYVLCGEEPASCSFFVQTAGGTCADQCALFGSECLDAFDSSPEAPCVSTSPDGCLAAHTTQTCTCVRPAAAVGGS